MIEVIDEGHRSRPIACAIDGTCNDKIAFHVLNRELLKKGLLYTFCEICVTIGSFYYIFIQYRCDNYFAIYLALQTFDADLSWQSLNITHKSIEKVYIVHQDDIFNIISVEHIQTLEDICLHNFGSLKTKSLNSRN